MSTKALQKSLHGDKVNLGAGYGLEIPFKYRLYGPKAYVDKMQEMIDSQRSTGRL